jgi:type III secretion system YscQ/HrcQ family protein
MISSLRTRLPLYSSAWHGAVRQLCRHVWRGLGGQALEFVGPANRFLGEVGTSSTGEKPKVFLGQDLQVRCMGWSLQEPMHLGESEAVQVIAQLATGVPVVVVVEQVNAWLTPWGGHLSASTCESSSQEEGALWPWWGSLQDDLIQAWGIERFETWASVQRGPSGAQFTFPATDGMSSAKGSVVNNTKPVWVWQQWLLSSPNTSGQVVALWLAWSLAQGSLVHSALLSTRKGISTDVDVPVLRPQEGAQLGGMPIHWHLELGSTMVSQEAWANVKPGDLVRLVHWQVRHDALAVCVYAVCADQQRLQAWSHLDGARVVVDSELTMEQEAEFGDASPASEPSIQLGSPVGSLEVRLGFELDEQLLPLRALHEIAPGYVFELGQPVESCQIRIRANGRLIGFGQLISVGDMLAVQVTEFVPTP